MVCDADVVWLQAMRFLSEDAARAALLCTFDTEGCPPIRSAVDLQRYDGFVSMLLKGIQKPRPGKETAVCHHMVLRKEIVKELMDEARRP